MSMKFRLLLNKFATWLWHKTYIVPEERLRNNLRKIEIEAKKQKCINCGENPLFRIEPNHP